MIDKRKTKMSKKLKHLYSWVREQKFYIQIISIIAVLLFIILPIVSLVNIFALCCPQVVKYLIVIALGISLGAFFLSFIYRGSRRVLRKIALKHMILLTSLFLCFLLLPMMCLVAQTIGINPMFSNLQFPLGTESKAVIALDSQGRLYYAIEAYKRIQVYNEQGEFIKGWFAPIIAEQDWDLYIDKEKSIHVIYNKKDYTYTSDGKLSSIIVEQNKAFEAVSNGTVTDKGNNRFQIDNVFWRSCVTKTSLDNKTSTFISEPFDLWLIKAPLPVIVFFIIIFLASAVLSRTIDKD